MFSLNSPNITIAPSMSHFLTDFRHFLDFEEISTAVGIDLEFVDIFQGILAYDYMFSEAEQRSQV